MGGNFLEAACKWHSLHLIPSSSFSPPLHFFFIHLHFPISPSFLFSAMKLIKINKLSPKHLFRSKKDRSVSRSDPSSFSSGTSSDASSTNYKPQSTSVSLDFGTPTSVLPEVSTDWSDIDVELLHLFKLLDKDSDGIISRSELEVLLSQLGPHPPSKEVVMSMLSEVDTDGNGCIRVDALMNRLGSVYEPAGDTELREAFQFFDTDRDGKITAEELRQVFTAIGDDRCTLDDCRHMIECVDRNGDGFVCFDDFRRMMDLHA